MNAPAPAQASAVQAPTDPALMQAAEARTQRIGAALRSGSESALINEFTSLVQAPQFLTGAFTDMAADRTYVSRDCMLATTQDAVAVNHVVRNQVMMLAYLGVFDPQPFCQPARQVGGLVAAPNERLAETMEVWLSHHLHLMRFGERMEGAAQDASTNAYAVVKVTLQDDLMRDAVGGARFGDMQEQVAEYLRLKELCDAGMCQEGTAEYQQYKDLDQTLRLFVAGKLEEQIQAVPVLVPGEVPVVDPVTGAPIVDPITGMPVTQTGMVVDPQDPREVERKAIIDGQEFDILGMPQLSHYRGFVADQLLPEDFRWDWRCTRPEDLPYCEWQAQRVFMSAAQIQRKWRLTGDDMKGITAARGGSTGNNTAQDPSLRTGLETTTVNDTVAVWELYHAPSRRRYTFVAGYPKFLANEVPQAVGRRFFPFFFVGFTRVSGQVQPISDVRLVRKLQDEVNQTRSHDREYRRAAYPSLFVPKGVLSPAAQETYRNRKPFSIIEAEQADDINKYLKESTSIPYNRELCDTARAESEMQQMFGLPMVVTGGNSGEDLASAMALAKEGMETGVARRRIQINRVITEILEWMAEISLKAFGLKSVQEVCGPAAVWPRLTSEQLYTNIRIEVKGGLSGQPRAKDRIDLWMNFASVAQSLGLPVNGVEVLRELLDSLGIRTDFTRFLMPVQLPGTVPAGANAPNATPAPKGATPEGGAPTMVERGAPDDLSQIPNHPATVPPAEPMSG